MVSIVNTGNRNVAALTPLDDKRFLRLTTPVRQNITTVTRDDARTTLEVVNLQTGEDTLAGVVPENPVVNVFGTTRFNTNPRMMAVNSAGTTAYMITLSGLSVVSLTPTRNGYAAGDRHGSARHREFGRRHAATSNRARSSPSTARIWPTPRPRTHSAADGAGRLLRDVRRYRGSAAGFLRAARFRRRSRTRCRRARTWWKCAR